MQIESPPTSPCRSSTIARIQPERAANRREPWYWWGRAWGVWLRGHGRAGACRPRTDPAKTAPRAAGGVVVAAASGAAMPALPTLAADPEVRRERYPPPYRRSFAHAHRLVALVLLAAAPTWPTSWSRAARPEERDCVAARAGGQPRPHRQPAVRGKPVACGGRRALARCSPIRAVGLLVALRQFSGSPRGARHHARRGVLALPPDCRRHRARLRPRPGLRATRADPAAELQVACGRWGWRALTPRPGTPFVQIGLSSLLLVGTGLFVRTLRNLHAWIPASMPGSSPYSVS